MTKTPTITVNAFHKMTAEEQAAFSGVVYSDIGRLNYAPVVRGAWVRRKDGKVRWFKYEMEAGRAALAAAKKHA